MASKIQIAIAMVDLRLCQIVALSWKRIGISLMVAAIIIKVVKGVINDVNRLC